MKQKPKQLTELHLLVTISQSGLMQTHCIGYPHQHVTYTNTLDHCISIKYKMSRIHHFVVHYCSSSCLISFEEVRSILFWVTISIKLLELGWLISIRHSQIVNPLHIWLGIQRESLNRSTILTFDGVCSRLLQLLNRRDAIEIKFCESLSFKTVFLVIILDGMCMIKFNNVTTLYVILER